ncbi:hypothetical protein [Gillisia limnaea]|uniref:Uncharacterized protein n=1 Tax=Gillisia limnaea (strain DSM 15749 / LMG 21470 / R-8282) TaxID=865937 RepID=H2BXX0_GILLR|nr:hypothetical protein [Gillisia limnaea]EHQ02133.1 hypothetical protein Gilli_1479 [Gillisia limnaea DSM 15749]
MEINVYLTYAISIIAIILSIIAYIQNWKIATRQSRIGRIEEILEITHILNMNYNYFYDTYFFKETVLSELKKNEDEEKYLRQIKALTDISNKIDLQKKLSRLYVINNSYLPKKELKDKIGVFIAVYSSLAGSTISEPIRKTDLPFNNFPKPWEFLEFTQEIHNELIREMNLGYNNNISNTNAYEKKFKERYNLE